MILFILGNAKVCLNSLTCGQLGIPMPVAENILCPLFIQSSYLCQRPSDSLHLVLFAYLSIFCRCHVILMTVVLSCVLKLSFAIDS